MSSLNNTPRGASAARIIIEEDRVIKLDTPATGVRVRRQGIWLRDYPNSHLPEVIRITSRGYEMKRLREVDLKVFLDEPLELLGECWRTYRKMTVEQRWRAWDVNPFVTLNPQLLDRYVVDLCHPLDAVAVADRLHEIRPAIAWPDRPEQLTWTHGDIILDNVMRNDEGFVVFIDAIPPCPALPSLPVVDFGRFIQSAAGYEQIRYTGSVPRSDVLEDRISTVLNWITDYAYCGEPFNVEGVRASLFYSVIHMLRGARTCRDRDDRQLMIDVASDVLMGELERWML